MNQGVVNPWNLLGAINGDDFFHLLYRGDGFKEF
jgi:hypothetical protein